MFVKPAFEAQLFTGQLFDLADVQALFIFQLMFFLAECFELAAEFLLLFVEVTLKFN